ncbi:MAG TPA: HAMP domain-containing histidine kinase [Candidatus Gallibacteroides avistercoris]|uniref:histidine kinase n=1 Tax=Candidatus Gallibacteroides avistercoris TaxID=2840833 RepID=A0A9D1M8E2_9BACT|nr:HAMP domain-containing histidine kinase [Candidatus Gallibacteroides avistercoris]
MKKSTIWLLVLIMAVTFAGLLYLQISYMGNIVKMREDQFSEIVKRCLWGVSRSLEKEETKKYLIDDLQDQIRYENEIGNYASTPDPSNDTLAQQAKPRVNLSIKHGGKTIVSSFQEIQETLERRVLYQRYLLDELTMEILRTSNNRPITERVDIRKAEMYLRQELQNNGLNVPFQLAISTNEGAIIAQSPDYQPKNKVNLFTQQLFPNDNSTYKLDVYFPTRPNYIYSTMKIFIPSFFFTLVLLITFLFTIVTAFRQKRLTEMKSDFINNMTHEFKTPISTISLAAQMLNDPVVSKSPQMFQHISGVINDETKRLRFQVEKVLQMSMFERQKTMLKLTSVDINDLVLSVATTFKLKVEKFGGTIETDLSATESMATVDEMHFTNVIFNLLDNAVKYSKEGRPIALFIKTWNTGDKIEISIQDNGIGIKKDDLKKIFDKFYRVSTGNVHNVKGFGLGLAYVNKIVRELKGTIRVESEYEVGTKFIITLPLIKN